MLRFRPLPLYPSVISPGAPMQRFGDPPPPHRKSGYYVGGKNALPQLGNEPQLLRHLSLSLVVMLKSILIFSLPFSSLASSFVTFYSVSNKNPLRSRFLLLIFLDLFLLNILPPVPHSSLSFLAHSSPSSSSCAL